MDNNKSLTSIDLSNVPEKLYDDVRQTVQELSKTGTIILKALNGILSSLQIWTLKKEYNVKEVAFMLDQKLQNLPPEKIIDPEPYVAVPALQAISYCMDSVELRNMFANLLANSMNVDVKSIVHPSFTEIIKQMSPIDAQVLRVFSVRSDQPIANYQIKHDNGSFITAYPNVFLECTEVEIPMATLSIDNLNRLGLIDITYSYSIADDIYYSKFKEDSFFATLNNTIINTPQFKNQMTYIQKGIARTTTLGDRFIQICLNAPVLS